MNDCCHTDHGKSKQRFDWLLWIGITLVGFGYGMHYLIGMEEDSGALGVYAHSVHELLNRMWWGLLLGIFFVGLLSRVPKDMVAKVIGRPGSVNGILRATAAGLLLDLCSHGILLVGMKLYERGASIGQVMAFLIASPWNSLSLTIILVSLIGLKWTLAFIVLSAVIAITTGIIADAFVRRRMLPRNQFASEHADSAPFFEQLKKLLKNASFTPRTFWFMARDGAKESGMILRWIFVGVVLASILRVVFSPDAFATWFGPTAAGLGLTIIMATIIEVCSEGSSPIAADILNRAHAPGNAFAFLMTGVSTDYTEIVSLKETTKSWRISFFLPLLTLPQIIVIGLLLQ